MIRPVESEEGPDSEGRKGHAPDARCHDAIRLPCTSAAGPSLGACRTALSFDPAGRQTKSHHRASDRDVSPPNEGFFLCVVGVWPGPTVARGAGGAELFAQLPRSKRLARAHSRKSFVDGAIEGVDQRSDMPPRQLGSGCALPHALQGRMGHLFALWAGLGRFHRIRRISRFAFEGNRSGCGPSVRACLHNRRTCALDARSSLRFCGSCCRIRCILAFEPNFEGSCFGCGPSVRECLRNWCTCA